MKGGRKNEPGCVYEWVGTVRNYVFKGKRRLILNANNSMPTPEAAECGISGIVVDGEVKP